MPRMPPVDDFGSWKEWLGSICWGHLDNANLVLLAEEPSENLRILDDLDRRLSDDLGLLFCVRHLRAGIGTSVNYPAHHAHRLAGSCFNGVPEIRQVVRMPRFYRTQGQEEAPLARELLAASVGLRARVAEIRADRTQFRRVTYGADSIANRTADRAASCRLIQSHRAWSIRVRQPRPPARE